MAELRHRQVSKKKSSALSSAKSEKSATFEDSIPETYIKGPQRDDKYRLALIAVTALAFVTRFYIINFPSEVVYAKTLYQLPQIC